MSEREREGGCEQGARDELREGSRREEKWTNDELEKGDLCRRV